MLDPEVWRVDLVWAGESADCSSTIVLLTVSCWYLLHFPGQRTLPEPPAPPHPLLWTWFKSAQSVSVHCFHGQLENLRNEWKQTVTDRLNCTLSSWQKRTPVGVPSSKNATNTAASSVGEVKRRTEMRKDLFAEQALGYAREAKADWHPINLSVALVSAHGIRLPRATPQLPFSGSSAEHRSPSRLLHFHWDSRILLGLVRLLQHVPIATSKGDRPCPLVSPNSLKSWITLFLRARGGGCSSTQFPWVNLR